MQEVLAVPLRLSNDFLGFLLAAGPRGAIPGDLTLIQLLGAQTSTALYVARLQQAEARRGRETAALAEDLRRQSELLTRTLRLQEELIDLVLLGKDAGAILAHVGRELDRPVWLLDDECRVIAAHAGPGETGGVIPGPAELRRTLWPIRADQGPQPVEMTVPSDRRTPFLAQSISSGQDTFGYLLVGSTALAPVDHGVFQGGRLVLTLRLLVERSIADAEERAGRELLADGLQNRGGIRTAAALALRLGYREGVVGPAVVLSTRIRATAGPGQRHQAGARRLASQELSIAGALVGSLDDEVVAIVRPEVAETVARQVTETLTATAAGVTIHVGISDISPKLTDLASGYREATSAAGVAERHGIPVLRFGDLGLYKLLFDTAHNGRIDAHIERWIGPLLRYDQEHKAQLCQTLSEFLCGENQADTARVLSIHPSTLKYRLGRIREVLGQDYTGAEARFNIQLALRLRESAAALTAMPTRQDQAAELP